MSTKLTEHIASTRVSPVECFQCDVAAEGNVWFSNCSKLPQRSTDSERSFSGLPCNTSTVTTCNSHGENCITNTTLLYSLNDYRNHILVYHLALKQELATILCTHVSQIQPSRNVMMLAVNIDICTKHSVFMFTWQLTADRVTPLDIF